MLERKTQIDRHIYKHLLRIFRAGVETLDVYVVANVGTYGDSGEGACSMTCRFEHIVSHMYMTNVTRMDFQQWGGFDS